MFQHAIIAARSGSPPSHAGWLARMAAMGLLGWWVCLLPALLTGAATFWPWNAVSAVALVMFSGMRAPGHGLPVTILCPIALCLALTLDLATLFPDTVLSLCGDTPGFKALALHMRWFPITMATMALQVTLASPPWRANGWYRRLATVPVGIAVMLITMEAASLLLRALAQQAHWPWVANGLGCAMLSGMLLYHLLQAIAQPLLAKAANHGRV